MIFQAKIGDYEVTLDDEMVDERPTPERAADYLHRCATTVLTLYTAAGMMEDDRAVEQD